MSAHLAPPDGAQSWSPSLPAVQKALSFIRRRGNVITPEEMVAWDFSHGCKLFDWNNTAAAEQWRLQQARVFLNSFRAIIDGMRVRAFINLPADETDGPENRQYVGTEEISRNDAWRTKVIDMLVRKIKRMASELKMWKLDEHEREQVLAQLRQAMEAR